MPCLPHGVHDRGALQGLPPVGHSVCVPCPRPHTRTPPCSSAAQDFVSVDVRVAYEPPAKRVCVKCNKESDGSAHLQTTMPCCRACVCKPCVTNAEFHVGVVDPSEDIAFPMECPGCSGMVCRDKVLDLGGFV